MGSLFPLLSLPSYIIYLIVNRLGVLFNATVACVRIDSIYMVGFMMVNKIRSRIETFPAVHAFVRLLPSMSFLVCDEIRTQVEPLPTVGALIRFLSRVSPLMSNKA